MIFETKKITLDYSKISNKDFGHETILNCYIPNEKPSIATYTPLRPSILILPGGGYAHTSEREAEAIAFHFVAKGMNAFVLYYSCAPSTFPVALLETLSAVRYIRENKDRFFADEHKVHVCGFSAGGHLAASAGVLYDCDECKKYFGDVQAVKPDALILGYPVITNEWPSHFGSFENLLGDKKDDKDMLTLTCLDKQVKKTTPPTFLFSSFEDRVVPCDSSLRFAMALKKCGVPFELHIYEKGVHGMATCDNVTCKVEQGHKELRMINWINDVTSWINEPRSAYLENSVM